MELTPDQIVRVLTEVGVPSIILLGIMWVANTFARTYFDRLIDRLERITADASKAVDATQSNRATIERVEQKVEHLNQIMTEIKVVLIKRIDEARE